MPRIPATIGPRGASVRQGPALAREQTTSRQGNAIQQAAKVASSVANALPFGDGNLLSGVTLIAGADTPLSHKLEAKAAGFLALNFTAGVNDIIRRSADDKKITLVSGGGCTCDVWVYK